MMAAVKIAPLLVLATAVIVGYLNPTLLNQASQKCKTVVLDIATIISAKISPPKQGAATQGSTTQPEDEKKTAKGKERLLTAEELARYDGSADSPGLYLAILGKVYDVEEGSQHYKPGSSYGVFTGKDASRAFVTGDFEEKGLTDEVVDLSGDLLLGLQDWAEFYAKDYKYVGKVVGRFYDQNGVGTDYKLKYEEALAMAKEEKSKEKDLTKIFPPCNSEWSHDLGGKVWCSPMSGGIERDWDGVPRKFFEPGRTDPRCVCVRNKGPASTNYGKEGSDNGDLDHPHLKEYANCLSDSNTCELERKEITP